MKTKQKQNMFMNNLLFVVSIEKLKYIREQNRFYLKIQKHDYTHTHTHRHTHALWAVAVDIDTNE